MPRIFPAACTGRNKACRTHQGFLLICPACENKGLIDIDSGVIRYFANAEILPKNFNLKAACSTLNSTVPIYSADIHKVVPFTCDKSVLCRALYYRHRKTKKHLHNLKFKYKTKETQKTKPQKRKQLHKA